MDIFIIVAAERAGTMGSNGWAVESCNCRWLSCKSNEEDVDEGDTISCDECGAALKVIGTEPLELESVDDLDEDEEDEDGFMEDEEEDEGDDDWK
jgi:alpha-aminoadipate carrier protein LysW